MFLTLRRSYLFLICLIIHLEFLKASPINQVCDTAIWNSTAKVTAGYTSAYSSTLDRLYNPIDVVFNANNYLFVVDQSNHRILRFPPGSDSSFYGTIVAGFNPSSGSGLNELYNPTALAIDSAGSMYIADTSNYRIMKYLTGQTSGSVAAGGRGSGTTSDKIGVSYGLALDNQSNIYVSEYSNHRVTKWVNTIAGTTIAGNGTAGSSTTQLYYPWGIYVDPSNTLYVVDQYNHRVQKYVTGNIIGITVAGQSAVAGSWSYQLYYPASVTFDQYFNMYVLDAGNNRIQLWRPSATYGITIASATMSSPRGLTFDSSGNFAIADQSYHRALLFQISCPLSTTTTAAPITNPPNQVCDTAVWNSTIKVAAGYTSAYSSTLDRLYNPIDVAFDGNNYLFVVDQSNHRVLRFPPGSTSSTSGVRIAGFNLASGSGYSELYNPGAIALDLNGTVYIADTSNYRVMKILPGQPLGSIVAGGRGSGSTLDKIGVCYGLALDSQSNLYVSEYGNHRVTKWINTIAGTIMAGNGTAGTSTTQLYYPWGIYIDSSNTLYVVDQYNHRVQKYVTGNIIGITVAGQSAVAGSWSYQLYYPASVTFDQYFNMYVLDAGNNRIQLWRPSATYGLTIASATMSSPRGLTFDSSGNLAVADQSYHRVALFQVSCPATTTTTIAPSTNPPNQVCITAVWNSTFQIVAGDTSAYASTLNRLYNPIDVAFDGNGYLFVVDQSNHRVLRFPPGSSSSTSGTRIAGFNLAAGSGYSELYNPGALALDLNGTVYIADTSNYRVMKILPGQPLGSIVAGGRGSGSTLDKIGVCYGLALDSQSNLYVSEYGNHRVTKWINTTAGILMAGTGTAGTNMTQLYYPWGLYIDSSNTLYIVDQYNHRVQKYIAGATSGVTVAGQSAVAGSWSYQLNYPASVTFDQYFNMYVLDAGNNRIQLWRPSAAYGLTIASATMSSARGLAFDPSGNLAVADQSYHRVVLFPVSCPSSTTTTIAPSTNSPNQICDTAVWNSTMKLAAGYTSAYASTLNRLYNPVDVEFDGNGYLFVVDQSNHRVLRFPPGSDSSSFGTTIAGFNLASGTGYSELSSPGAIVLDLDSTAYIADTSNYRVMKYLSGQPLGSIVAGGRGNGATLDKIGACYGLALDSQSNLYVSDYGNHRVTKWINSTAGILMAGTGTAGTSTTQLYYPWGIYIDSSNTLYVVDQYNHRVQKYLAGNMTGITVAGQSAVPGSWSYLLYYPASVTFDQYFNMYVLDAGNNRIQLWRPSATYGITIASATMSSPRGLAFDPSGNLAVADQSYHRVALFQVSCPSTTTTTVAPSTSAPNQICATAIWNTTGRIVAGYTSAYSSTFDRLYNPIDVKFDGNGYMFVVDQSNHRVLRFPNGSTSATYGVPIAGFNLASGTGYSELSSPGAIVLDLDSTVYIADTGNYRIMKYLSGQPLGSIVAGGRGSGATLDKIAACYGLALDSQSNLYVSEYGNHRVTKWINSTAGILMAGTGTAGTSTTQLYYPWGIYVDVNNALYIVDQYNHRVQKYISGATSGVTVAGQSAVAGSWSYQLYYPASVTFDQYGYMYVLDAGNNRIQRLLPGSAYATTIASATMSSPRGLAFDPYGNIAVADQSYHRVLLFAVSCLPLTTTTPPWPTLPPNLACQTGVYNNSWIIVAGATGSSSTALNRLSSPQDVFIDGYNFIYVADYGNNRILNFPPDSLNGTAGTRLAGYTTSGGSSLSELSSPTGIFMDLPGALYIYDAGNYRIFKWLPGQPVGTVIAGGRGVGSTLDKISFGYGLYVDNQGSIYVSEYNNQRVTRWDNSTAGIIVAGTGVAGSTLSQLQYPWGIYVDSNFTLYVVDSANHRVQRWNRGAPNGTTVAGTSGVSGSTAFHLSSPTAITFDSSGYLYTMDSANNRVLRYDPGSNLGVVVATASFSSPRGMRLDSSGNLFVTDQSHRIIKFPCVYNTSTTTLSTTTVTTSTSSTTSVTTATTVTTTTTTATTVTTVTTTTVTLLSSVISSAGSSTVSSGSGGSTVSSGSGSTVSSGSGSTVSSGSGSTVSSGSGSTVSSGTGSTVSSGSGSTVSSGSGSTVSSGTGTTVSSGTGPTVSSGTGSTVSSGGGSTVSSGSGSTVSSGSGSTVSSGGGSTVSSGSGSTVSSGSGSTVSSGSGSTVSSGSGSTVSGGGGGSTVSSGGGSTVSSGSGGGSTVSSGGSGGSTTSSGSGGGGSNEGSSSSIGAIAGGAAGGVAAIAAAGGLIFAIRRYLKRRQTNTKNNVTPATNTKKVTISLPSGQRITSFENELNSSLVKSKNSPPTSAATNSSLDKSSKGPQGVRKFDFDHRIYNIHTIR